MPGELSITDGVRLMQDAIGGSLRDLRALRGGRPPPPCPAKQLRATIAAQSKQLETAQGGQVTGTRARLRCLYMGRVNSAPLVDISGWPFCRLPESNADASHHHLSQRSPTEVPLLAKRLKLSAPVLPTSRRSLYHFRPSRRTARVAELETSLDDIRQKLPQMSAEADRAYLELQVRTIPDLNTATDDVWTGPAATGEDYTGPTATGEDWTYSYR